MNEKLKLVYVFCCPKCDHDRLLYYDAFWLDEGEQVGDDYIYPVVLLSRDNNENYFIKYLWGGYEVEEEELDINDSRFFCEKCGLTHQFKILDGIKEGYLKPGYYLNVIKFFPTWTIPYLEGISAHSTSGKEYFNKFLQDNPELSFGTFSYTGKEYFCWRPLFGKACNCIDIFVTSSIYD